MERASAFPAVALHFKGCARTVPNDPGFLRLGLASSEKQIPEIVENVANSKHRMEGLERLGVLAKQVLSQLSYTPTVATAANSKASGSVRKPRNAIRCLNGLAPGIGAQ
jgi:hypothetical protein